MATRSKRSNRALSPRDSPAEANPDPSCLAASLIGQGAFWVALFLLNLAHFHRGRAVLGALGIAGAVTWAARRVWTRAADSPSLPAARFRDPRTGSRAARREAQKRAAKRRQ